MKTLIFSMTLLLFLVAGCEEPETSQEKAQLTGFNIEGQEASCEPMMKDKACTEIYTAEDRFASKCREEGHTVIQCDCHKFLCQTKDGAPLPFE